MAYMSQEKKKALHPKIKAILKKYDMKGTLSIRHHSELVLTLKSGVLDFAGKFINEYWLEDNFGGKALSFLQEVIEAMNIGNFDKSDVQSDYFHVGWYSNIDIGKWDKPYIKIPMVS